MRFLLLIVVSTLAGCSASGPAERRQVQQAGSVSDSMAVEILAEAGVRVDCVKQRLALGIREQSISNGLPYTTNALTWLRLFKEDRVPSPVYSELFCGRPAIGTKRDAVRMARGAPLRTTQHVVSGSAVEFWHYDGVVVEITNGKVTMITFSR